MARVTYVICLPWILYVWDTSVVRVSELFGHAYGIHQASVSHSLMFMSGLDLAYPT
jgi:hypothetical protein